MVLRFGAVAGFASIASCSASPNKLNSPVVARASRPARRERLAPVAAGVSSRRGGIEPGVPPGGPGSRNVCALGTAGTGPGGKMPPSTAGETAAATPNPRPALKSSPNNLRPIELNSNSTSSPFSFSSSGGRSFNFSNSIGQGVSHRMVTSRLESSAWSRFVSSVSLTRPFNSPVWPSKFSTLSYWPMSLIAVFFSDARHSRNVVGGVAHQRQHFHDLLGPLDAPAGFYLRQPHDFHAVTPARRLIQKRVLVHQLAKILVGRDHIGFEPFLLRPPDERPDDIIRLETVAGQHRNVEGLDHPPHVWQGLAQLFRHRLARSLVLGIFSVPLSGRFSIKRHRNVRRLLVFQDIEQRLRKPIQRRRVHSFGREDRPGNEREVRPIYQRHAVQQE